jgi:hypothetical protein
MADSAGNKWIEWWGGDWRSTAAITSITLTPSGSFIAGTIAVLYGLP